MKTCKVSKPLFFAGDMLMIVQFDGDTIIESVSLDRFESMDGTPDLAYAAEHLKNYIVESYGDFGLTVFEWDLNLTLE